MVSEPDSSILISNPGIYSLQFNDCPYLSTEFIVNFHEFSLFMVILNSTDSYLYRGQSNIIIIITDIYVHWWVN